MGRKRTLASNIICLRVYLKQTDGQQPGQKPTIEQILMNGSLTPDHCRSILHRQPLSTPTLPFSHGSFAILSIKTEKRLKREVIFFLSFFRQAAMLILYAFFLRPAVFLMAHRQAIASHTIHAGASLEKSRPKSPQSICWVSMFLQFVHQPRRECGGF
jgi:hypothetical protein